MLFTNNTQQSAYYEHELRVCDTVQCDIFKTTFGSNMFPRYSSHRTWTFKSSGKRRRVHCGHNPPNLSFPKYYCDSFTSHGYQRNLKLSEVWHRKHCTPQNGHFVPNTKTIRWMLFTEITFILRIHVRFRAKVKQFSHPHTGSEAHPTYWSMTGGRFFSRRYNSRGVTLVPHLHLMPKLKMCGAINPLPIHIPKEKGSSL